MTDTRNKTQISASVKHRKVSHFINCHPTQEATEK
jgi:hypothetical protein